MPNQDPLNPDALRRAADAVSELYADGYSPKAEDAAEVAVSTYLAVAQPVDMPGTYTMGTEVEALKSHERREAMKAQPVASTIFDLLDTRVGIALANTVFEEGMGAGIKACNKAVDGEPFVKPDNPYSKAHLAMIRADQQEAKDD